MSAAHASAMLNRRRVRPLSIGSLVLALGVVAPGGAAAATRARLVHCGGETCVEVSGKRPHAGVAVRIAGRAVRVAGATSWRATLPFSTARGGVDASGAMLMVTLVDPATGSEQVQTAMLPPGALGRPVELATLVVSAH